MEKTFGVFSYKNPSELKVNARRPHRQPENQNEVVLIQKHRNLRHPQGFGGGEGARWGVYYRKKSGSKY